MATLPITKRGAEILKAELHKLKTVERPAVINAISEARAQGDLSENAEYESAKDKQGFVEAVSYTHLDVYKRQVWALGHEGQGVCEALQTRAARHVRIAQPGGEESLNVAAAAAICLHASATASLG